MIGAERTPEDVTEITARGVDAEVVVDRDSVPSVLLKHDTPREVESALATRNPWMPVDPSCKHADAPVLAIVTVCTVVPAVVSSMRSILVALAASGPLPTARNVTMLPGVNAAPKTAEGYARRMQHVAARHAVKRIEGPPSWLLQVRGIL